MRREGDAPGPAVERFPFGRTPSGEAVEAYILREPGGLAVSVLTYGAIIQELRAPDRDGRVGNVVLGFPSLDGYLTYAGHCFGAVAGRYANRIGGGRFELEGVVYELSRNIGENTLHGGAEGFDRRVWEAVEPDPTDPRLVLRLTSPDGDMGFPGTLAVEVDYRLEGSSLQIDFRARTDAPTVLNLTSHAYWNLVGEGAGSVDGHQLTLFASSYTPVDGSLIPTGEISPVAGTPLDFRRSTPIGARIRGRFPRFGVVRGYDNNFVLDGDAAGAMAHAASVVEPSAGRTLDVLTTEPGIQLYTGNALNGAMVGTSGRTYGPRHGFALETQHFPDSPNHPGFPSTVLRPGERFESSTVFRLGTTGR